MLFLLSLCNQVEYVYMCELHKGAAFSKGSIGMKDCLDERAGHNETLLLPINGPRWL